MFDVQDQNFNTKFVQNKEELKEMFDVQDQKLDKKLDQKFGVMKKELETKIDTKFEEAQNFMGVLVEDLEDDIKIVSEMVVQNTEDIAVIKQDIKEMKEELRGKVDRSECLFFRKACAR